MKLATVNITELHHHDIHEVTPDGILWKIINNCLSCTNKEI